MDDLRLGAKALYRNKKQETAGYPGLLQAQHTLQMPRFRNSVRNRMLRAVTLLRSMITRGTARTRPTRQPPGVRRQARGPGLTHRLQ